MKRFAFSLRPVAVLREHRELRAREALAAALQALARAREQHARAREQLARFGEAIATRRSGRFAAAAEAQNLAGYRRECAIEAEASRHVATAHAALERQRLDHLEAHRQLERVRRLEAKARTAHRLVSARVEQAEFDDLGLRCRSNRPSFSVL